MFSGRVNKTDPNYYLSVFFFLHGSYKLQFPKSASSSRLSSLLIRDQAPALPSLNLNKPRCFTNTAGQFPSVRTYRSPPRPLPKTSARGKQA